MPSTLIELMLRSPDSNNLAKASLREGHSTGRLRTGRLPSPLQVVPSFGCLQRQVSEGPRRGHGLTHTPPQMPTLNPDP